MKISYKILKSYLPYIASAEEIAGKLILHTAEVEEILSEKSAFKNIVVGKITKIEKHPDADSLFVCQVDIGEESETQIVCGGSNLFVGQKVAVAKIGASVVWHGQWDPVVMKKTLLRWVESSGMICASEEIWLKKEFPAQDEKEILDLSFLDNLPGTNLADALWKNDEVLEIDNKAINHRPDMFSYIGVMREIATLYGKNLDLDYTSMDFSSLPSLSFENQISNQVKRYSLLQVSWVENIDSNDEIKTILQAAGHTSKWLLVDLSNYSLYFYGQPAHIFDADTIEGKISVRFAKNGETLRALDEKTYELSENDIVIADEKKILALWWIIWGISSAVSDTTKNILIEAAHFDQAILRKTGKRLGIRTDALNVFEKDILPQTAQYATALILENVKKYFPHLELKWYFDSYPKPQETITQLFDLDFYNHLLGTSYSETEVKEILHHLGIKIENNTLLIPFWRKELTTKADIAEEIARIMGYDTISATIPRINLGAIMQSSLYNLKNDAKKYFTHRWFFEVYNYSFVNQALQEKLWMSIENLVALKNSLSDEQTHMRDSLIPNLMRWGEENIRNRSHISLFEVEKVFFKEKQDISEKTYLSWIITSEKDIIYYDVQTMLRDFFASVGVEKYAFQKPKDAPAFAHKWRVAEIIFRGKSIGYLGEIHPNIAKRFDISQRVWFFEIDAEMLAQGAYSKVKAKEISQFQENSFDISVEIDKQIPGKEIEQAIASVNTSLIQKVELIDIYENEEKLAGKRSITWRVYIQSLEGTLGDDVKTKLLWDTIAKIEKKWGIIR